MMNRSSGGLELANFMVTSGAIHQAWAAIEEQEEINPHAELSSYNEILKSNPTIIAFGTPRSSLQGKEGLISSSALKEDDFSHFDFLCSKSTPYFSINESAINIFRSNYNDLNLLRNKLVQISSHSSSIIITGRSVGGCVAILFTLWLLDGFNLSKTRHPLCITFGSPLLGDECPQQCVSEFSTWKSCFLHIASDQDPIPKFFLSKNPSATYKPFGTFLLCSASGFACIEEPDSILERLVTATPQSSQSQDPEQFFDYGKILEALEVTPLCKDKMELVKGELNPFQAMSQRKNVSNSFKKLSEMQCDMAILGWHKKEAKREKIGLYDMYKKLPNTSDDTVVPDSVAEEEFKPHEGGDFFWKKLLNTSDMVFPDYKKLMRYWEDSVAEEEFKPHKEGDFFWDRWLLAGTSYRRMVEPLHIAEYYKKDARNYITDGRPRHFILLEQWWNERKKPEASQNNAWIKRQVAASRLNADSCFWAHVEEAIISCNLLDNDKDSNVRDRESSKLKEFEGYVYDAINKNEVSLDIFLEGSSFRQWWNMYEAIMGSSYSSSLMRKFWEGMKTLTNLNQQTKTERESNRRKEEEVELGHSTPPSYLVSRQLPSSCEQESQWMYNTQRVLESSNNKRPLEDGEEVALRKAWKHACNLALSHTKSDPPNDQNDALSHANCDQPSEQNLDHSHAESDQPYDQNLADSHAQSGQPNDQSPAFSHANSYRPNDQDHDGNNYGPSSLFHQLGRDVLIRCLLRCSRADYGSVAMLCRSFRSVIRSGELYTLRRKTGIVEHWAYFSCALSEWWAFNPDRGRWMPLPKMESKECFMFSDKESLAVGSELLVFGKEITSHVVYKYSLLTHRWSSGQLMNTPRCLFASASSGEIAILVGGCDPCGNILSTAELYNSETGTWLTLPSMNKPRKMSSGVFMDGKFYVIGGIGKGSSNALSCGEVYDLERKTWTEIPNMHPRKGGAGGPDLPAIAEAPPLLAVVNNILYAADHAEQEVKKYDKERNVWITIGKLPERTSSMNGWGVAFRACGNRLIVIGGSGLSTLGPIEINSWVPDEGPPQWNLLAVKDQGGFVYNCAVMGC